MLVLYKHTIDKNIIIYSLCIYTGVTWQIFTLTHRGHVILNKLDTFLNSIIKKGGEIYEKK